jgi:hypothetical protein
MPLESAFEIRLTLDSITRSQVRPLLPKAATTTSARRSSRYSLRPRIHRSSRTFLCSGSQKQAAITTPRLVFFKIV